VALQTDVNAAALAEGRWGGARGLADHAYVTIGTGVGVGLIVGGRPAGGVAHGEMGHIRVGRATGDTWPGACPFHGDCVEGLISGPALAARHGRPGTEIPPAHRDWDLFEHTLTGLLHTLVLTLVPARIAIGGGVVAGRAEMFAALRRRLAHSLNGYGAMRDYCADLDQRIGPPGLGDLAGPLGPIALGLDALCA
jgi:fructokinase